jgi:hypothetical protein
MGYVGGLRGGGKGGNAVEDYYSLKRGVKKRIKG